MRIVLTDALLRVNVKVRAELAMLLSDRNDTYAFHWGLYLAKTDDSGIVYELYNEMPSGAWAYRSS